MSEDEMRETLARTLGEAWITSGPRAWDEQSEARRQGARHLAVHACPEDGSGVTGCCGRTPFELGMDSRMTLDPALVTCAPSPDRHPPSVEHRAIAKQILDTAPLLDLGGAIAAALAAAEAAGAEREQRGRDDVRARVLALADKWEREAPPFTWARQLRALLDGETP